MPDLDHQEDFVSPTAADNEVWDKPSVANGQGLLSPHDDESLGIYQRHQGTPFDSGVKEAHQPFACTEFHRQSVNGPLVG
ncbi:hypothetical protein ACSFA8_22480 [Variovorax sp. RT4R15]|uniref:hypothetical protein n=1 Tax=Variovorax sp. RT4R15 TaxID=3443737 RepID=UPI003F4527BE